MKKARLLLVILALFVCALPVNAEGNVIFSDEFVTDTTNEYRTNGPSLAWNESSKTLSITGKDWKSADKLITNDTMDSGKLVIEYSIESATSNKSFNFGVMINGEVIYSSDIKNLSGETLCAVIDKDSGTYTVYDKNNNIKSAAVSIPANYPLQGFCLNMGNGSVITLKSIKIYTVEKHTEDMFFLDDFLTDTTDKYISNRPKLTWNESDKSLTITGKDWKSVDKLITDDEDYGKAIIEYAIKFSTSNKVFNFGIMINDEVIYSSDIKNMTGSVLRAVVDKDSGTYTVYDENDNIKSAPVNIPAGCPIQGFCLNMGTDSVITFDYIKAYYAKEAARENLYYDDFSSANGAITIQPQKAQLTIEDGVATVFSKTLANPKVVIPAFPAVCDSLIIEFRVKKISGGTIRFYLDNAKTEILLLDLPECYEWTVFNLLFDFKNGSVQVYKDGILYNTVEFTYINRSDLSPRMAHSINGNGVMYDYFKAYYPAKPTLEISEKTVAKVVLKSDTPISDEQIDTITIGSAQVKNIKRRYLDEIVITFEEPLAENEEYVISTNDVKDIFGNMFNSNIKLSFSDKITVKNLECSEENGTTIVNGEITNDNFISKEIELVLCNYSNERLVSAQIREVRLQPGNNTITEAFKTEENTVTKCFVWSSFVEMMMID